MDRLRGIKSKIEWAKEHIGDLDAAIRAFHESKPYTLGAKPHPIAEIQHTTLFVERANEVPARIALIIGDAIHNLRSALDHLAWQLVEAGGGVPNRATAFPIHKTAKGYATALKKGRINGMKPQAQKLIEAIQPYNTGDDTLWHISELDNVDKHRLVVTVATAYKGWGVGAFSGEGVWFPERFSIPLIPGQDIVHISTFTYNSERHENFKLKIDVTFNEVEIIAGKPALETLDGMLKFVEHTVGGFERFLV